MRDGRVEKRKAGRGAWRYRLVVRVPESEAAASPVAGGGPAVPKRYAATLRLLADPPPALAVDAPEEWAVGYALNTLAADCGYKLESFRLVAAAEALEAP